MSLDCYSKHLFMPSWWLEDITRKQRIDKISFSSINLLPSEFFDFAENDIKKKASKNRFSEERMELYSRARLSAMLAHMILHIT